jgi:hypothetical protein
MFEKSLKHQDKAIPFADWCINDEDFIKYFQKKIKINYYTKGFFIKNKIKKVVLINKYIKIVFSKLSKALNYYHKVNYNKKYWKIPIVYGALATSLYFYAENNQLYHEFRDVYKRRLEGYTDDKYQGIYTDNVVINAQKTYQRNRDLSLLITFGIYALNIIDANVDAHLIQFNVNEKLSVKPDVKQNFFDTNYNVGLTLNYNF